MSSGKTARGELPPKKGTQHQEKTNVKNSLSTKGDPKSDKVDLTPKLLPTAEQMQIARIIDSHRPEDPELQRKIKQVMEITRTTEDKASMALHSRENNVEEAITLLTEGGSESLESEWEQAGKKRKPKPVAQKPDTSKDVGQRKEGNSVDKTGRERSEKRSDRERDSRTDRPDRENEQLQQGEGGNFESRRGGRGRGSGMRGGRGGSRGSGRIENNKENDETNGSTRGYPSKYANGPGRGGGTRGRGGRGGYRGGDRERDGGRTFANRARGGPRNPEGEFGSSTIDVWDNRQADPKADKNQMKVEKWDEFPSAEDWDNEEYTGSLTESKVFTPSTQPSSGSVSTAPVDTKVTGSNVISGEPAGNGPANHIGSVASLNAGQPIGVKAGQSIDVKLLLQQPQQTTNPGANLLASIQSSYSSAAAAASQIQHPVQPQQSMPQRQKVQPPTTRSRIAPPGKLPTSGVEMPDDSVAKLDVQFGGLEFSSSGSGFNSGVTQQSGPTTKIGGGGDMMFPQQSATVADHYSSTPSDKSDSKSNVVPQPTQQTSPSPFQNQRAGSAPSNESLSATGKPSTVSNIENLQKTGAVQSSTQQSQQPGYGTTNSAVSGSAFVPFNTKPAPGFSAPGFPAVSQTQQTGAYGNVPNYGSQPSNPMLLPQPSGYHGINLSSYATPPQSIVTTSVPPTQTQGILGQLTNSSFGAVTGHIPANPYHSTTTAPNSTGYAGNSSYGGYGGVQKLPNSLSTASGKEVTSDVSGQTVSGSNSAQLGNAAASSASKLSQQGSVTSASSNTTGTTSGSKIQSNAIPPGMMLQPQYILNQGVPMYSFQGPTMYGYDENMQFLQRLPHPAALAAGYYDANATNYGMSMPHELHDINTFPFIAPGGVPGTGRNDGSSLQTYPGGDARFPRTDSSTASPVPSNLPGQTSQQPMYNLPQATPYYYLGNTNAAAMMHPGAFPYGPPPTLYQSTAMQITPPTNPSTGAPHTVSNHQYQGKGIGGGYSGNSYMNPYESPSSGPMTGGSGGPSNVTDYVNKNSYGTGGSGVSNSNSAKGSASSSVTGSTSQQSTDMSSSIYGGNKSHLNKMNTYDKQGSYGSSTSSPYSSMGQSSNPLGGSGMGTAYYMPPQQPVLPMFLQDNSSGQRQGGQPKGGNKQYGSQQQYWSSN